MDPEDFWRSAGLPASKFPDPNGTRFPNGAPPPAPPVLRGHPGSSGTGRTPGIAVLLHAGHPDGKSPSATRSAAAVESAAVRPRRRSVRWAGIPGTPGRPRTRRPTPTGLPPTPGVPIAGRPGDPPPGRSRHTGAAAARKHPPGARTEHAGTGGAGADHRRRSHRAAPGAAGTARARATSYRRPFINPGGAGGSGAAGGSQN